MTKLDPVSPGPKFSSGPNYPDILALQARVAQLEAALREIDAHGTAMRKRHSGPGGCDSASMQRNLDLHKQATTFKKMALEALSTPAPNVSPLWGILWALARTEELHAGSYERGSCRCDACVIVKRLITPELRTLIEEMAQGGRE